MLEILQKNLPVLNLKSSGAGGGNLKLDDFGKVLLAAGEIVRVPALLKCGTKFLGRPCARGTYVGADAIINSEEWGVLLGAFNEFKHQATLLEACLREAVPPQDPHTLVVEIGRAGDLHALGKVVEELAFTADRVIALAQEMEGGEKAGGTVPRLQNFDSGSFYLELTMSADALTVFGQILTLAFAFLQETMRFEESENRAESYGLGKEDMKSMLETNCKLRRMISRRLAEDFAKKGGLSDKGQELISVAQNLIERNSEQIQNGMRFFAGAQTPPEIVKAFPTELARYFPRERPQLKAGKDDSSNTGDKKNAA
jgi:hypothetical protein